MFLIKNNLIKITKSEKYAIKINATENTNSDVIASPNAMVIKRTIIPIIRRSFISSDREFIEAISDNKRSFGLSLTTFFDSEVFLNGFLICITK
jgi:hypothetical protein